MKWDTEDPPSIAAYMQGLQPRPVVHFIWMMPEGVTLQEAMRNIHRGWCWCGSHSRQRDRYGCCTSHSRAWAKATEWWWKVRDRALAGSRGMCAICGTAGYPEAVDHILSIKAGGDPWAQSNLRALCTACHNRKAKRDATDRRAYRITGGSRPMDQFID